MVKFLVLALFYGDHPELAHRCGSTLRALWNTGRVDLRIGLNEVSARSRAILERLLPGVEMLSAQPQIYKYPMMRRLLQGYGGDATHMMWFDDDSCLLPGVEVSGWLDAVAARAQGTRGTLGAVYTCALSPRQQAWLREQPWSTGRAVPDTITFNLGGWFVAPLELLRRFDYPGPMLSHFGGDRTLGALLHQQGLQPEQFVVGLAIGADENLEPLAAPRRGTVQGAGAPGTDIWGGPA